MRRLALALVVVLVCQVALEGTTLVIFRTASSVILATDSAAVKLDRTGRHHVQVDCKIWQSGTWFFVVGGFVGTTSDDERDRIAATLATVTTIPEALKALDDRSRLDRIRANRKLFDSRQAGSPLMTVVIASPSLELGVLMVSLKSVDGFKLTTESGTCPGRLCPTGGYYLIGEPGNAEANPMVANLPAWFMKADGHAARRFITEQIAFSPQLARPPIDTLEITATGARWIDRSPESTCAPIR